MYMLDVLVTSGMQEHISMKVWVKYENGLEAPVDYEPTHGYTKVQSFPDEHGWVMDLMTWYSRPTHGPPPATHQPILSNF